VSHYQSASGRMKETLSIPAACRSCWRQNAPTPPRIVHDIGAREKRATARKEREMTDRHPADAAGAFYIRAQSGVWRHRRGTKPTPDGMLRLCLPPKLEPMRRRPANSRTNRSCRSIQRLVCLRRRARLSYGLRLRKLDHSTSFSRNVAE